MEQNTLRGLAERFFKVVYEQKRYVGNLENAPNRNYLLKRVEIFARTFEQYVTVELNNKGLNYTLLGKKYENRGIYFNEQEYRKIKPSFKKLVDAMVKGLNNSEVNNSNFSLVRALKDEAPQSKSKYLFNIWQD